MSDETNIKSKTPSHTILPLATINEIRNKTHHITRVEQIITEVKQRVTSTYPVLDMRLFGSVARGDDTPDSDIDIFVRLPQVTRRIEEDLFDIAYEIELKYNCLIDMIILADSLLRTYAEQIPIYQTIVKEGLIL